MPNSIARAARAITNIELWDTLRAMYPNFSSHTAKATADLFTANGFDRLKQYDPAALNDFFGLSLRVWLNVVNISHARDPLEAAGFGESFQQEWGGYVQRLAVGSVKPISPAYKGLKNGDSPDPFVVRKPVTSERFWKQNFDYQSLITVPDDYQFKQIFVGQYGMSEYMAGIMEGLQNGYTIQVYLNKLEALDAALRSSTDPLQATQKVIAPMSASPTDEELKAWILAVKDIITAIETQPQVSAYNAIGFASTQDVGRLKLLVRAGIKNRIAVTTMVGAYNPEQLSLPVDIIEVPHFGGLQPYTDDALTTPAYPVYNALGEEIGYSATEGSETAELTQIYWKDPNLNVNAVLADKGVIFEARQNPYTVEAIRNPRGLYTNYWASSPNNAILYDPLYNLITFTNS